MAILVLVAAALILPSFIDWTAFRKPIEAEASRLAGRPVTISGDIGISMLPRPSLRLGGLALADPARANEPILSAGRLEATAAWLPLFAGKIEIVRLRLADAVIRVRIDKDGRLNWLRPKDGRPGSSRDTDVLAPRGSAAAARTGISARRLSFSDIIVERSRILYADERNGADDRIEKVSGRFSLKSLYGPWEGKAGFEIQNAPLSLAFKVPAFTPNTATLVELVFRNSRRQRFLHAQRERQQPFARRRYGALRAREFRRQARGLRGTIEAHGARPRRPRPARQRSRVARLEPRLEPAALDPGARRRRRRARPGRPEGHREHPSRPHRRRFRDAARTQDAASRSLAFL
ncbi:MAG: AsmA family protein [Alphaproteobacteria bacterium]